MPSPTTLLTFAAAAFVLIVIPGPSVLFTLGRSIALGRAAGITSVAGNTLGSLGLVAAVALGVGALVAASDVAFTIVKFAGAAYLVYLGVRTILQRKAKAAVATDASPAPLRRIFGQAVVVGFTNPKTLAFFVAVLPQFASPDAGPMPLQLGILGLLFGLIAFCSDSVWALVAGSARDWFAHSPRRIETLSATGGAMMIALGGVLAFARRAA